MDTLLIDLMGGGLVINWLDSVIDLHTLIWLFPVFFMIHDFEEIIWVESWTEIHVETLYATVPKPFKRVVKSFHGMKSSQFAVAVALEFIIFLPVTLMASDFHHYLLFIGFNLILFLHVFTHLGQSLLLKMYTPGVVTAVFVLPPYTFYLFHRFAHAGILHWGNAWISLLAAMPLLPIILLGHRLGKLIVR
jgi:hypothetical protein